MRAVVRGLVIPVYEPVTRTGSTAAAYRWRLMWHCAVFKDRGEAYNAGRPRVARPRHLRRDRSYPDLGFAITGGRRSLKTQQHAGVVVVAAARVAPEVAREPLERTPVQPGSVDMLGPIRLDAAVPHARFGRVRARRPRGTVRVPRVGYDGPWIGAPLGAP